MEEMVGVGVVFFKKKKRTKTKCVVLDDFKQHRIYDTPEFPAFLLKIRTIQYGGRLLEIEARDSSSAASDLKQGGVSSKSPIDTVVASSLRLGWRIQKHDEAVVQNFCNEIGMKRHTCSRTIQYGGRLLEARDLSSAASDLKHGRVSSKSPTDTVVASSLRLGWRIQKHDEAVVHNFCNETGMKSTCPFGCTTTNTSLVRNINVWYK